MAIVESSCTDGVVVGRSVVSLNGQETSSLTPSKVAQLFDSRESRITPVLAATDLSYHGFTASKLRKQQKTIVTESNLDHVPVGMEVISIDGIPASALTPSMLSNLLATRGPILIPCMRHVPVQSDLDFHRFMVTKAQTARRTTISESLETMYVVGAEVKSLDGQSLSELSPYQIRELFRNRTSRLIPEMALPKNDIPSDATQYASMMSDIAMFFICALCGEEGPSKGSVAIDECSTLLQQTNIQELYDNLTSCLRSSGQQNSYDVAFAKEVEYFLPSGLLRGETKLCRNCFRALSKKDNKPISLGSNISKLPKDSLVCGLFTGSIPAELKSLNNIEISIVSIYSSISKISLQGGKNYTVNGALSYTIVNDITSVAQRLPRMPSIESIAILRHGSGLHAKDYKYRPYYVKEALTWLVANNHIYSEIEIRWPNEVDWDDESGSVEPPYLPLSENDIRAIDEDQDSITQQSGINQINRGKILLTLLQIKTTYSFMSLQFEKMYPQEIEKYCL